MASENQTLDSFWTSSLLELVRGLGERKSRHQGRSQNLEPPGSALLNIGVKHVYEQCWIVFSLWFDRFRRGPATSTAKRSFAPGTHLPWQDMLVVIIGNVRSSNQRYLNIFFEIKILNIFCEIKIFNILIIILSPTCIFVAILVLFRDRILTFSKFMRPGMFFLNSSTHILLVFLNTIIIIER